MALVGPRRTVSQRVLRRVLVRLTMPAPGGALSFGLVTQVLTKASMPGEHLRKPIMESTVCAIHPFH